MDLVPITVASSSASLVAGDVVCIASDAGKRRITLATPAALAVAGRAYGIVPVSCAPLAEAKVRRFGAMDPAITGLAATAGPVRVSSVGRCELVSSLGTGDYPLGDADSLGWLDVQPGRVFAGGSGAGSVLQSFVTPMGDGFFQSLVDGTFSTIFSVGIQIHGSGANRVRAFAQIAGVNSSPPPDAVMLQIWDATSSASLIEFPWLPNPGADVLNGASFFGESIGLAPGNYTIAVRAKGVGSNRDGFVVNPAAEGNGGSLLLQEISE